MSLKDIFCQERAIGQLQRALAAGKVPHAYIFAGPDGVGKLTCARQWAQVLLCRDRRVEDGGGGVFYDSCGRCESCRAFAADNHPDFTLVYKELLQYTNQGKGRKEPVNLSILVVREFLLDKVARRPQLSEGSVFVICEAEKLSIEAQNALLKILEEPPVFCHIILLCTRMEKLLPTTRSRCQVVRFGPIEASIIAQRLSEAGIAGPEGRFWAAFSEGSLGQALEWAALRDEHNSMYAVKTKLISRLARFEPGEAVDLAEWILQQAALLTKIWAGQAGKVNAAELKRSLYKTIIRMVAVAFYDAWRLDIGSADEFINADQRKEIAELARRFRPGYEELVEQAFRSVSWLEANVNEKLVFERLLLRCAGSDIMDDGLTVAGDRS